MKSGQLALFFREEGSLFVSIATALIFFLWNDRLLGDLSNVVWLAFVFAWLFSVVLSSAIAVVRHADHLADALGEPFGTLVLTLAVTFIEVISISAVMLHGENNPTLARDTILAIVMIILNGMVGLSLFMGAWGHREQHYNLQGANAYLGVIIPLIVLSLILPNFTQTTPGPTLSATQQGFLALSSVGLYCAFLLMQTGRHRDLFVDTEPDCVAAKPARPLAFTTILLVAYLIPVVLLAEQLARPIDYLVETLSYPAAVGGVVIAVLVATPEAIGAVRAATANHLQRSVNIFLGSVLATTGLTIPSMLVVSYLTGRNIIIGVEHTDVVILLLTLCVSVVTFASGRTNVIQGAVHLVIFAVYLLLIIEG